MATTPEEIAASIIAELVQRRGSIAGTPAGGESHPIHAIETAQENATPAAEETAIDPVCGMTVEIATARHHTSYESREFYFCCPSCKRHFERNPQEYLVGNEK